MGDSESLWIKDFVFTNNTQSRLIVNGQPLLLGIMVGTARFELATSCSQSRRTSQAVLRPVLIRASSIA